MKFEKEWEQIAEDKNNKQTQALKDELQEHQRQRVDLLVDKVTELNIFEMRYFSVSLRDRIQKTTGMNPLKLNMDWPSIKKDADGTWPPLNPNWFKQQELMSQVGPFLGGMGLGGGAGGAPAQGAEGGGEGQEEVKKETLKSTFDVELTSFDAKGKIKLIKELRSVLGLGLKEAKEIVEGAPVWIKKDIKKDEAEELMKKFEPLGAQLKMV